MSRLAISMHAVTNSKPALKVFVRSRSHPTTVRVSAVPSMPTVLTTAMPIGRDRCEMYVAGSVQKMLWAANPPTEQPINPAN